jgi:hypothetical protein
MGSTVAAHRIPTKQRLTDTAVPLVAIPLRAGKQTLAKTKVSVAAGCRRAPWTVVAGSNLALATAPLGVQAGQTERVAVGIAWATEVYRKALAVAQEAAPWAELRMEEAKALRERAVRGAPPAWAAAVAGHVAAVGDGGNQS